MGWPIKQIETSAHFWKWDGGEKSSDENVHMGICKFLVMF